MTRLLVLVLIIAVFDGASSLVVKQPPVDWGGKWCGAGTCVNIAQEGNKVTGTETTFGTVGTGTVDGNSITYSWPAGSAWAGTFSGTRSGSTISWHGGVTWSLEAATCFNASQWLVDFPRSENADYKEFSQGNQDGVLTSLFSPQNLGTTNKGFVEFGFPDTTFSTSYGNGHHLIANMGFHPELLLDGNNENPDIKLHKHFLTAQNIVSIFEKYNVSKEADYVSIDIDSCDIWLFMAITKKFRPRVLTVEYNSNYGIDSYQAMSCQHDWQDYTWAGDNLYGASLSAIFLAAQRHGYTMVYATKSLDTFLVRNDLICPGTAPPLSVFTYATNLPLHRAYADEQGSRHMLVMDFKQWLAEHPNA